MQFDLTRKTLHVESSAFRPDGAIPSRFTADGADVPPPLAWDRPPVDTRSVAIVVEDPDAPDPARPQRTFTHWIVTGIPPEVTSIEGRLPAGAAVGKNDFGDTRWRGPKPPTGKHRYFFKVYALDIELSHPEIDREHLLSVIGGHVIAQGTVMGTYAHRA